jgi:hypothetical protein
MLDRNPKDGSAREKHSEKYRPNSSCIVTAHCGNRRWLNAVGVSELPKSYTLAGLFLLIFGAGWRRQNCYENEMELSWSADTLGSTERLTMLPVSETHIG